MSAAKRPDGTTTFRYSPTGALLAVHGGKADVDYTLDGYGRRVAASVGGTTSALIAYLDDVRPAATYRPDGSVDQQYVYDGGLTPARINDGGGTLPAYLTAGGTDYLEIPDATGGPGLVINSADGTIANATRRTAYGTVVAQTHPGFQLIGYGGGIADPTTGLVRFGARDYDPAIGRWLQPDPRSIGGGSANLYEFLRGDPVNRTDPRGACDFASVGISASGGLGPNAGGGSIGLVWAGNGEIGTYSGASWGPGVGGNVSFGLTFGCADTDDGDTSLGNFAGPGSSAEVSANGIGVGYDIGYDDAGNRNSHGGHITIGAGAGIDASYQYGIVSTVCLLHCRSAIVPLCEDGCDSAPGNSPNDPTAEGFAFFFPPSHGARSAGDPHIRTADDAYYDLQAVGEFTWLTTDDRSLIVQVRHAPVTGSRTVALTTAAALLIGGDRLQVAVDPKTGALVLGSTTTRDLPAAGPSPSPTGRRWSAVPARSASRRRTAPRSTCKRSPAASTCSRPSQTRCTATSTAWSDRSAGPPPRWCRPPTGPRSPWKPCRTMTPATGRSPTRGGSSRPTRCSPTIRVATPPRSTTPRSPTVTARSSRPPDRTQRARRALG